MALSPSERTLRAQLASHTRWSREADPSAATAPARAAFNERFLDEVDPERKLPAEERERRAAHARKAYYKRLAMKSVRARQGVPNDAA